MKRKSENKIDMVLNNSFNLRALSQTFAILDELNHILHGFLPAHLKQHCHIGAINNEENYIILYLDDPAVQHLIYNLANPILENFNKHHFSFAGIVTKTSPQKKDNSKIKYKKLDEKYKDKLQEMANSINKTNLVHDHDDDDDLEEKEIDL